MKESIVLRLKGGGDPTSENSTEDSPDEKENCTDKQGLQGNKDEIENNEGGEKTRTRKEGNIASVYDFEDVTYSPVDDSDQDKDYQPDESDLSPPKKKAKVP